MFFLQDKSEVFPLCCCILCKNEHFSCEECYKHQLSPFKCPECEETIQKKGMSKCKLFSDLYQTIQYQQACEPRIIAFLNAKKEDLRKIKNQLVESSSSQQMIFEKLQKYYNIYIQQAESGDKIEHQTIDKEKQPIPFEDHENISRLMNEIEGKRQTIKKLKEAILGEEDIPQQVRLTNKSLITDRQRYILYFSKKKEEEEKEEALSRRKSAIIENMSIS